MVAQLILAPTLAKAIDRYIDLRFDETPPAAKIDPRLQSIIEAIFRRCIDEGEYRQVIPLCSRQLPPPHVSALRQLELLWNPVGST